MVRARAADSPKKSGGLAEERLKVNASELMARLTDIVVVLNRLMISGRRFTEDWPKFRRRLMQIFHPRVFCSFVKVVFVQADPCKGIEVRDPVWCVYILLEGLFPHLQHIM